MNDSEVYIWEQCGSNKLVNDVFSRWDDNDDLLGTV